VGVCPLAQSSRQLIFLTIYEGFLLLEYSRISVALIRISERGSCFF